MTILMAHSLRSCTTHQPHSTVCVSNTSVNIKFRVLQPRRAAFLPASARNSSTFLLTLTQNYNAEVHEALAIFFLMTDQTLHKQKSNWGIRKKKLYWVYKHSFHFQFAAVSALFRHIRPPLYYENDYKCTGKL